MQPVACGHSQQAPQLHPPAWRRRAAPHTFATAMALGVLASRLAGAHQARVSHDVKDLASPSANIIHIRRPKLAAPWRGDTASASWLSAPTGGVQAVVDAHKPDAAAAHLLSPVQHPGLQQQLHADLLAAVRQLAATLQRDHVSARLQLVRNTSCPKWHADTVRLRLLCTYAGPGTWFVANRFVRRSLNPLTGDVAVAGVQGEHAQQAAAGDLLFLKGSSFPGLQGAGAVHKSPALQEGQVRLLLTVDDACC